MSRSAVLSLHLMTATAFALGCGPAQTNKVSAAAESPEAAGSAGQSDAPPGIGDPAPAWSNLSGVDDQQHSLEDLADWDAVAIVFTCNHCPIAVAYEDRLIQLADDYADKSFKLVAINVNRAEEEKLPAMKTRAAEKRFQFAYLHDPSQQIGRAFGATVTPQVYLLDKNRNVAYMGAIDDSHILDKVENHYLRDAVDAVLAGETPAKATTQQFGCGITYE